MSRSSARRVLERIPLVGGSLVAGGRTLRAYRRALQDHETVVANQRAIARALAALEPFDTDPWTQELHSRVCRSVDCVGPGYAQWCERLAVAPDPYRKIWEYVYIAAVLDQHGSLRSGSSGLGFGVGREPMPAYFAARGCDLVVTDLDEEAAVEQGWASGERSAHAASIEPLRRPHVCDDATFTRSVSHRSVDMTDIPADLRGFDFCWSTCALEHLGSLRAGLDFVVDSVECLRPGGVAVHTTEFNVTSDDATIESGPTVVYRRRDLEELDRRLAARGHRLVPIDHADGDALLDNFVDLPPFDVSPLLRMRLRGHTITSIGLVVLAGEAS